MDKVWIIRERVACVDGLDIMAFHLAVDSGETAEVYITSRKGPDGSPQKVAVRGKTRLVADDYDAFEAHVYPENRIVNRDALMQERAALLEKSVSINERIAALNGILGG